MLQFEQVGLLVSRTKILCVIPFDDSQYILNNAQILTKSARKQGLQQEQCNKCRSVIEHGMLAYRKTTVLYS